MNVSLQSASLEMALATLAKEEKRSFEGLYRALSKALRKQMRLSLETRDLGGKDPEFFDLIVPITTYASPETDAFLEKCRLILRLLGYNMQYRSGQEFEQGTAPRGFAGDIWYHSLANDFRVCTIQKEGDKPQSTEWVTLKTKGKKEKVVLPITFRVMVIPHIYPQA